ncbi:MAG: four helix bundle protein [Chitinophagales bacterium]|nr:four helix bundle protein [Chitinophagales bacterium]
MTKEELKKRTKEFALRIIKVVDSLPKTTSGFVIGKQLIKSGTSVGANYRAACRGRSDAEFLSKITIVEGEADETLFWLEIIVESEMFPKKKLEDIMKEADELTAIFTATGKSMKAKLNRAGK